MTGPFRDELLRRLRLVDADAGLTATGDGITWRAHSGAMATLVTCEDELAEAIRSTGQDARAGLWPDRTIEEAGLTLLLIHLDEVLATRDVTEPLRVTREGLIWPEHQPSADGAQLDPGDGPYYWSAERPDDEGRIPR